MLTTEWYILFAMEYSIRDTILQEILGWGGSFFSPHVVGGCNTCIEKNANVYQVYTLSVAAILVLKKTLTSTKSTRDQGRTLGLQKSIPLSLSTRLLISRSFLDKSDRLQVCMTKRTVLCATWSGLSYRRERRHLVQIRFDADCNL